MVCKIVFYSEFPDIPDKAGRVTRRRTQAIAKRYAFHANAIMNFSWVFFKEVSKDFFHRTHPCIFAVIVNKLCTVFLR